MTHNVRKNVERLDSAGPITSRNCRLLWYLDFLAMEEYGHCRRSDSVIATSNPQRRDSNFLKPFTSHRSRKGFNKTRVEAEAGFLSGPTGLSVRNIFETIPLAISLTYIWPLIRLQHCRTSTCQNDLFHNLRSVVTNPSQNILKTSVCILFPIEISTVFLEWYTVVPDSRL